MPETRSAARPSAQSPSSTGPTGRSRLPIRPAPRVRIRAAVAGLALTCGLAAQDPEKAPDWRLPYRTPSTKIAPPESLFQIARRLESIYTAAPETDRGTRDGYDIVDSDEWRQTFGEFERLQLQAGYLSLLIRDSNVVEDRRTAFFTAFYTPVDDTVRLFIEHIPGEPSREIREEAYQRAVRWMEAHDRPDRELSPEEVEFIEQNVPSTNRRELVDLTPFLAVLDLEPAIDREQALWFLRQAAKIHPGYAKSILELGYPRLLELAEDDDEGVRLSLVALAAAIDPNEDRARSVPGVEDSATPDPAAIRAWLKEIRDDLLPPIRRVSAGLYEIYPSEDRDEIVEVGKRWLQEGDFGENVTGRDSKGVVYYGLRLPPMPEPLDRLGIPAGVVLVAISGNIVRRPAQISELLGVYGSEGRSFFAEFVDPSGIRRAVQYRMMREQ